MYKNIVVLFIIFFIFQFSINCQEYQSLEELKAAAESGDSNAQYFLGAHYQFEDNDYDSISDKKAIYWYEKSSEQNNAFGCYGLAWYYQFGIVVQKDIKKALNLYLKSAELGYVGAQAVVGRKYLEDNSTEQNIEKAIYWLEKASEQGHAHSQYLLGKIYYEGNGTEKDITKAIHWFQQALKQENYLTQEYWEENNLAKYQN